MTSLKDYQKRIDALAREKGWSDDLHWLELGTFKEVGELVQAMERYEASLNTMHELPQCDWESYYFKVVGPCHDDIKKEFADVIHFLFQSMHHFDIDLDKAVDMVIEDNRSRAKKTIDAEGKIVRK